MRHKNNTTPAQSRPSLHHTQALNPNNWSELQIVSTGGSNSRQGLRDMPDAFIRPAFCFQQVRPFTHFTFSRVINLLNNTSDHGMNWNIHRHQTLAGINTCIVIAQFQVSQARLKTSKDKERYSLSKGFLMVSLMASTTTREDDRLRSIETQILPHIARAHLSNSHFNT